MPEQPTARVPRRASRMTWSLVCALPLGGIPAGAIAQSVPPGLRACAAVSDSLRRLVCYDQEMARLTKSAPQPAVAPPAPAPPPAPPPPPPPPSAAPPPVQASTPPPAASGGQHRGHRASQALDVEKLCWRRCSRVTAHVAGLDRSPDSMVLHLDNGQVWQQIGPASGNLTLQVGDSVTIEKHLGSYWLSSRYVSDMKVRLQAQ